MKMQIQLTTTGARSGKPRPVTLYAWEDDDRLVIVASKGGSARNPAWVHNLRADPHATVKLGRRSVQMHAREVTDPDERARLWELVVSRFPLYATYQKRTDRVIPLFALDDRA
jgi:F420H(2)-dependent quinone reductase